MRNRPKVNYQSLFESLFKPFYENMNNKRPSLNYVTLIFCAFPPILCSTFSYLKKSVERQALGNDDVRHPVQVTSRMKFPLYKTAENQESKKFVLKFILALRLRIFHLTLLKHVCVMLGKGEGSIALGPSTRKTSNTFVEKLERFRWPGNSKKENLFYTFGKGGWLKKAFTLEE